MRRESEPPGSRKHSPQRSASGSYISPHSSSNSAVTISSIRSGVKTPGRPSANQPKLASQLTSNASQRFRLGGRGKPLGNVRASSASGVSERGLGSGLSPQKPAMAVGSARICAMTSSIRSLPCVAIPPTCGVFRLPIAALPPVQNRLDAVQPPFYGLAGKVETSQPVRINRAGWGEQKEQAAEAQRLAWRGG